MSFKKNVENFTCEKCGFNVVGDGFTNHCPKCLWSKHVDVDPGDRKGICLGMMKPVRTEASGDKFYLVHRCEVCKFEKRNKVGEKDDFNQVVEIAKKYSDEISKK